MRVFVDNDVILDVLLKRGGFEHSQELIARIESKVLTGYTSAMVLVNTYYIVRRLKSAETAWLAVKKLRLLFKIAGCSQKEVDLAMAADFRDFEDAVQYYCAMAVKADYLVTRNKKDYRSAKIAVVTPAEYLSLQKN